jgi:hypothetical protein
MSVISEAVTDTTDIVSFLMDKKPLVFREAFCLHGEQWSGYL